MKAHMIMMRHKNAPKMLLLLLTCTMSILLVIDTPLTNLLEQDVEYKKTPLHHNMHPVHMMAKQILQQPIIDASSISTSLIDPTISERLTWQSEDKCDRVFLFMPYFFSGHGQGFQINCYLMAAVMATFMDMALVVLEPPHDLNRFETWSQVSYICVIFTVSFTMF